MKKLNKFISVLIAVVLAVSLAASAGFAAYNPNPSPGREDVEIFDEDVPLGELPDTSNATVIVLAPAPVTPVDPAQPGEGEGEGEPVAPAEPPAIEVPHELVLQAVEEAKADESDAILLAVEATQVEKPAPAPQQPGEEPSGEEPATPWYEETVTAVVAVSLPVQSIVHVAEETTAALVVSSDAGEAVIPSQTLSLLAKIIEEKQAAAAPAQGSDSSDPTPAAPAAPAALTIEIKAHESKASDNLLSKIDVSTVQGSDQITEVNLKFGDDKITSFGGEALSLLLPLTDEEYEEDVEYPVMQISDNGVISRLKGKAVFRDGVMSMQVTVTHLSYFVVLKDEVPTVEIEDPEVPLVESPQTGGESMVPVVAVCAVAASTLAAGWVFRKKI